LKKKEQLSIPVLGALLPYVEGTLTPEAENQTIEIANMFRQEYKNMLNEHTQIVVALDSGNVKLAVITAPFFIFVYLNRKFRMLK
jgi:hypothetical protein